MVKGVKQITVFIGCAIQHCAEMRFLPKHVCVRNLPAGIGLTGKGSV